MTARAHQARGFTLLEAIVALVIIAAVIIPLLSFVSATAQALITAAETNERSFAQQAAEHPGIVVVADHAQAAHIGLEPAEHGAHVSGAAQARLAILLVAPQHLVQFGLAQPFQGPLFRPLFGWLVHVT